MGEIALRLGSEQDAKSYLLAAANVSGSVILNWAGPDTHLARQLFDLGEKEVVVEYFRRCSKFWQSDDHPSGDD